jgi:diguanylate cyclase (GGDEF)-like protein/PAS domain S-box-containing protein
VPELRLPTFSAVLNLPTGSLKWARAVFALTLACYLSGRLSLELPSFGPLAAVLWPVTGIALVAMMRAGSGMWLGAWLGAFLVALSSVASVWRAAFFATGNTLGPLLAAYLLRQSKLNHRLEQRRDLWLYASVGVPCIVLVNEVFSAAWAMANGAGHWDQTAVMLFHEALGNALGMITVGISLLTCSRAMLTKPLVGPRSAATLALFSGAVASGWLAFAAPPGVTLMLLPLLLIPHLLLAWLAARAGLFVAVTAALLVCIGAALGTAAGLGPLQVFDAARSAALLWGYLVTVAATPLLMSTLIADMLIEGRRSSMALDASQTCVAHLEVRTGQLEVTPRWSSLLSSPSDGSTQSIHDLWGQVHPDDIRSLKRLLDPSPAYGLGDRCSECRFLNASGQWAWFEVRAFVVEQEADGSAQQMVLVLRDSSERHVAQELQRLSDNVFQHLNEGLLITDAQNTVLQVNPIYCQITGFTAEELLGTVPPLLRSAPPGSAQAEVQARLHGALRTHGMWQGELVTPRRSGEACTLRATVSVVKNSDGEVQYHVLALTDITQSRQQIAQLLRQAHFDALTGLPNRVRLTQFLLEGLAASERDGSLLTVCYLDLDHFKPVNDEFGHYAGDRLLLKLAERLRKSLRTSSAGDDIVARIGGDEFVLLLRSASLEESRAAVERMLQIVAMPFALSAGDAPVVVTASIGATVFPLDNADAETLLRHADHAMYGAKQAGRNGFLFFDAERDRLAEARFVELGRVQEALDAEELCLHFQPKVDMRHGRVLGVEALLRWNHPEQGMLSPAKFLPLIEHTGLSVAVGEWVLKKGVEQLARWQSIGLDLTVSINVSARHLQEPLFANHLAKLLACQPANVADRLVLEVLETTALADIDFTCGLMEQCRALGVRFALDDFGTGYSTLTYLKRLPLDMLKIDRSFVINMLKDRQDMAIVQGVIGLSETFGCTVVAEGVETLEQAQALIEIGCDIGQGNGIAWAMPAEEVVAWVHSYGGLETMAAPLAD